MRAFGGRLRQGGSLWPPGMTGESGASVGGKRLQPLALLASPVRLHLVERSSSRASQLEATVREITEELQEMPITPHVRELRAKAVTYARVIGSWATYTPTAPQVQAMLECVTELQQKVQETKQEANRDVSRVTRRHPDEDLRGAKKPTPPLPSGVPPSFAWNASVPDTGARARGHSNPVPRGEAPTTRPPAPLSSPSTVPPVSAPRAIDAPTPIPALLRARRSRG